jgi:hypothetical protein
MESSSVALPRGEAALALLCDARAAAALSAPGSRASAAREAVLRALPPAWIKRALAHALFAGEDSKSVASSGGLGAWSAPSRAALVLGAACAADGRLAPALRGATTLFARAASATAGAALVIVDGEEVADA